MRFRDDPILYIREKLREYRQKSVRLAIAEKWQNDIDPRIHWVKDTDKENEGLATNPQEWAAQKLHLSNIGHFAAERMHNWLKWVLMPVILIFFIIECLSVVWGDKQDIDIEPFLTLKSKFQSNKRLIFQQLGLSVETSQKYNNFPQGYTIFIFKR